MFTQRLSMDCTREQYEKYLKEELLKMGYDDTEVTFGRDKTIIVNNANDEMGALCTLTSFRKEKYNRLYLGSFNAPLFLALAAMTDNPIGIDEEYYTNGRNLIIRKFVLIKTVSIDGVFRKATKKEIMAKFSKTQADITYDAAKEFVEYFCDRANNLKVAAICDNIHQSAKNAKEREKDIIEKLINVLDEGIRLVSKSDMVPIDYLGVIPIKGNYYYCKSGDTEWAFISSGDKKHKTGFFCAMNLNSGFFDSNCYIAPDKDIDYIRLATNDEKDILNKKMAEKGKYFNQDKCKIMRIEEKCSDLSEDTAQELLRLTNKLWRDVEDYHIKWLKERGYKILKPKTWEEV